MNGLRTRVRQFTRLIQREAADHYVFLTLLSFAASVSLTRLFLSLTGYPQVGGGELHIAHMLWGGLLLYVASLLPLLFANRRVYSMGALLAGAGIGLFIDEVGKFITQRNDYFFPVSASIIYMLFLLTLALFFEIRHASRRQARDAVTRLFEDVWEALHYPLTNAEYRRLRARLETAAQSAPSERHASLANALLTFLDTDAPASPASDAALGKSGTSSRRYARLIAHDSLRLYLVIGLVPIAALTLKNPLTVLLATSMPQVSSWLSSLHIGREVPAAAAPFWFSVRLGLEVFVGTLMLISAGLLAAKRHRLGAATGYWALLLSLTVVNVLVFYFEQFSTIISTALQFILLIGMIIYRRHGR